MLTIPLQMLTFSAFPDHGWRFGLVNDFRAFYIAIDGTNAVRI